MEVLMLRLASAHHRLFIGNQLDCANATRQQLLFLMAMDK